MNHDLYVLRALARLSRQRKVVDDGALVLRAGGTAEDVQAALSRLAEDGFVTFTGGDRTVRLTLGGLAVAVASGRASRSSRALPTTERRRADAPLRTPRRRAA